MPLQYNITGDSTQSLILPGDSVHIESLSLANIHSSSPVTIDVYIEKKLTGRFYVIKNYQLLHGSTLILDDKHINVNTSTGNWGLYIKLNNTDSAVDVIIN